MNSYKLNMPGLHTPRLVLLMRGSIDGRFGVAALDPNSGLLNSPYLTSRRYRFQELTHQRIIRLENDSAGLRTEAAALLHEYKSLTAATPEASEHTTVTPVAATCRCPTTMLDGQTQRAVARAAAKATEAETRRRESIEKDAARRTEIINRLTEIRDRITTRERVCQEELGAISDALSNRFAIYACGALLKPFPSSIIPEVEFRSHLDGYFADHTELMRSIHAVLKEEENHHVAVL